MAARRLIRRAVRVAALAGALLSLGSSSALAAGAISGTVTGPGAAPLAGICVQALANLGTTSAIGTATTDSTGSYAIPGLVAGSYAVSFRDCSVSGDHAIEYYNDQPSRDTAQLVVVDGVQTVAGISAHMVLAGKVSGTVTDTNGSPVSGLCVATNSALGHTDGGSATTDAQGKYAIGGLQSGSYRVGFASCPSAVDWVQQWFDHKSNSLESTLFPVVVGQTTTGINAVLVRSGHVAGMIFSGSAAEGLAGTPEAPYPTQVTTGFTHYPRFSGGAAYPSSLTIRYPDGLRLGADADAVGCVSISIPFPVSGPVPDCPIGSEVGSGHATFALPAQELPVELIAYNNAAGDGLLIVARGVGDVVYTGALDAARHVLTISLPNSSPFPGTWKGLTAFSLTLGSTAAQATAQNRTGWVRATDCSGGAWPITVDLAASDGAGAHAAGSVPCAATVAPGQLQALVPAEASSPAPALAPPPAAIEASAALLLGARTLTVRRGAFRPICRLAGPGVTGCRASVTRGNGRSRVLIADGTRTGHGGDLPVTAHLTRRGRALLARHRGRLRARLVLDALAGARVVATSSVTVQLSLPRSRHS